jgi:RecJ-like exonuclease
MYECEYCQGRGRIVVFTEEKQKIKLTKFDPEIDIPSINYPKKTMEFKTCEYCNGEGQLDWIENIFGKKESLDQKRNEHLDAMVNYMIHTSFNNFKIINPDCVVDISKVVS